jgi:hypothetical protein
MSKINQIDFENVLVEKHKKKRKDGETTFYKVFIDYEWCCDIALKDMLVQQIGLVTKLDTDTIKNEIANL